MQLIPVLDLKEGRAVHAVRGQRARYRPVKGVLGHGNDAVALALAFRDQLGSQTLYVADLDAIGGAPGNVDLVRTMVEAGLALWVDAGVSTVEQARTLADLGVNRVVIGSETLHSLDQITTLATGFSPTRLLLSVDMVSGALRAPPGVNRPGDLVELAARNSFAGVILLDLSRVGSRAGPPLEPLISLKKRFPRLPFYVGGGVRHRADLDALAEAGAAGVLVATALHLGVLTRLDIQ